MHKITRTYSDETEMEGILIVNSYGRVRKVWMDGTYEDVEEGRQIEKQV